MEKQMEKLKPFYHEFEFDTWRCPNPLCKYVITDVEIQAAIFNYPCQNCHRSKLGDFILQPYVKKRGTNGEIKRRIKVAGK